MALNWGILGAGSVAQRRVIPTMQSLDGHTVSALMVRDMKRAQTLATQFNVSAAHSGVDALIDDENVNAVYVSSPVNLHHKHVLRVAQAGKHVLCEKPMGMTVAECEEMMDVCEKSNVHLQVCFVLRGWDIYHQIRHKIQVGDFGDIVEIKAHLAKWTPFDDGGWRLDPSQSGGGVLMDMGAHYFDLFRFLLGDFEQVACMGSSKVFGWAVEDSAFVIARFQNGTHATMGLSFGIPHNGNVLEIYGTKGSLFLGSNLRMVTKSGETVEDVCFPDYYSGLLTNFADCVRGKATPIASGLDGLRNIQIIEAAYESGKTGKIVSLLS